MGARGNDMAAGRNQMIPVTEDAARALRCAWLDDDQQPAREAPEHLENSGQYVLRDFGQRIAGDDDIGFRDVSKRRLQIG